MVSSGIHVQPAYQTLFVPQLPPDEDAGKFLSDLFAAHGEYTIILLAQGASYNLQSKIFMKSNHQELATEGYPADNVDKARLFTRGKEEAGAIHAVNKEHIAIRNICIHGCRTDYGWLKDSAALVAVGGWDAKEPVIENCVLADPRGWSCCHLIDGSQGGRIVGNQVGPAGQPPPDGPWADGLSIACRDGLIANNTIIDATDGAIVVFCAPGTLITGNTIIARSRNLMGGINMVDPFPFKANFTNTRVVGNRILTEAAYIHLGIGIGSTTWGDMHDIQNYGGSVLGNIIGPGRFGYGIAAAGCRDFTVLGNRIAGKTSFVGSMDVIPRVSPPTAFLRIDDGWAQGTFQSDFVEGPVRYLPGVRDGLGRAVQYHAGALQWQSDHTLELKDTRVELASEGRLIVWDRHHQGRVLWSSPSAFESLRSNASSVKLCLDRTSGRLTITTDSPSPHVLWDPLAALGNTGFETRSKDPVLHISDAVPYLQVKDGCSTLYTTHQQWHTFELAADEFVASYSAAEDGQMDSPPPVPYDSRPITLKDALSSIHLSSSAPSAHPTTPSSGRCAFLWLDPQTSQLILHTSRHPRKVEKNRIVWVSPNWKTPSSEPSDPSKATLQEDGNFVIYAGKAGAVWATGTNGSGKGADTVAIEYTGTPIFSLLHHSRMVWSSVSKR